MSNDQCAAIIKAIQTACEFILYSGVQGWRPVGDASADSDAKDAAVSDFSDKMDAIIADLPDETP